MASKVGICNRALSRLGASRITSLTDNKATAKACNDAFDFVRDEVLRAHPWNSASARASLAAESTSPAFGYAYQYEQPVDCLRVLELYGLTDSDIWVVEGTRILTDVTPPIDIRYVRREEDPNKYDALLASTIAARLAAEIAEEITASNTKVARAWETYENIILPLARAVEGREQSSVPTEDDTWVSRRF